VHLFFLWLSSADLAVERVLQRFEAGGHFVRDDIVRRRYAAGIRNFFSLYRPIVTTWVLFNASGPALVRVADGLASETVGVYDSHVWDTVNRQGTA
jgi:predicted ABC-type ATPase